MSLLVVYLVPQGILFAADRNLSKPTGGRIVTVDEAAKVIAWPDGSAVVGYVGRASVEGEPADSWLARFVAEHPDTSDLDPICGELAERLEDAMSTVPTEKRGMILHVASIDARDPDGLPVIYYVRDMQIRDDGKPGFEHLARFESRNELPRYFGARTGAEIREALGAREPGNPGPWFGFRQGFDLSAFNELDRALWWFRGRLVAGVASEREHPPPETLDDWAKFVRLSVLGYEAYFLSFYAPDEQLVGGGVDVVTVPWP